MTGDSSSSSEHQKRFSCAQALAMFRVIPGSNLNAFRLKAAFFSLTVKSLLGRCYYGADFTSSCDNKLTPSFKGLFKTLCFNVSAAERIKVRTSGSTGLKYLSARLGREPHRTASPGRRAAGLRYLAGQTRGRHEDEVTGSEPRCGTQVCDVIHTQKGPSFFCAFVHCVNGATVKHERGPLGFSARALKPEHWWLFSDSIVNGTGFV